MSAPLLKISTADLLPMDMFLRDEPIAVDVVYANASHPENIFGTAAYHANARMILHRDLASIVLAAARMLNARHGWTLVLKDGLRPIEAQQVLIETDIVKRNPHWLQEPRLLSSPGQGAHPRGMAIDVCVTDKNGMTVDMGTTFDEMTPQSARAYDGFDKSILANRAVLEQSFAASAEKLNLPLLPLPSEWWDFRIPSSHCGQYAPLSDKDLPGPLKMRSAPQADPDWAEKADALAKSIRMSL
jgi:D-alanyl-D-alanine dipeptidase